MSGTAGDYAILSDALRVTTGHLALTPQSARDTAVEAVAQLWQRPVLVITGVQFAGICHAAQAAADPIGPTRASLMADISAAVAAHELAAHQLGSLRGPLMRPDLSDGPDGHDVAAHIDTAIRCGRAAYAVLHAITDPLEKTPHVHPDH